MKIVGILIVGGVLLWLFFITLPYLWWLWLLLFGILLIALAKLNNSVKKEDEETKRLFSKSSEG